MQNLHHHQVHFHCHECKVNCHPIIIEYTQYQITPEFVVELNNMTEQMAEVVAPSINKVLRAIVTLLIPHSTLLRRINVVSRINKIILIH